VRASYVVALGLVGSLALLLLVGPTLVVLITSFTSSAALRFPPPGLSLGPYRSLIFDSPEIVAAALVSLRVAVTATLFATVLAVAAGLGISRSRAGWARLADTLLMSPLLLPSLALGLGLLLVFSALSVSLSITTLIVGHVVICAPFILRTTLANLAQLDPALEESSRSLGGRPWFTFLNVTLPQIRGGVMAGAFLAFMASYDNVAISLFLADAESEVLPLRMWNIIENMLDVRAAAASGVLIGLTVLLLLVMERIANLSRYVR
jgi:putative spermidine/putrescine transport system permease protein